MGKYDDKRIVACPECKCVLFSVDLERHFLKRHKKELSAKELVEMLFGSEQESVNSCKAADFLARLEERDARRPKIERTPRSMQQWEGGTPREGMRSGPLGPG